MDKENTGRKSFVSNVTISLYVKKNAQRTSNARDSILQQMRNPIVVVCTQQASQEQRLEKTKENIVKERRVR